MAPDADRAALHTLWPLGLAPFREQIEQQFSHHRYRCRFCHLVLDAWFPTAKAVDEALVLDHLSQSCDPNHAGLYLKRMRVEGIATVAAEAFEVVDLTPVESQEVVNKGQRKGA